MLNFIKRKEDNFIKQEPGVVYEAESEYNILKNDDDELMVAIEARGGGPENARVLYAGGKHGLLVRDSGMRVILKYIHPVIRKVLRRTKKVLIMELRDGSPEREYEAVVEHVMRLPIPRQYKKKYKL